MTVVTRSQAGLQHPRYTVSTNITAHPMNTLHYGGPALGGFPWSHSRCASIWRAWQAYHFSKGWADIAYTAGVCIHGYVYVGRWFGRRTGAQGTNDGNFRSLAVCYMAGAGEPLTASAKSGFLEYLSLSRANGYATREVRLHQNWKPTACPGDLIEAWHAAGMPPSGTPLPTPSPQPVPPPTNDTPRSRTATLQRLLGVSADGIFGPQTDAAIMRRLIGWEKEVARKRGSFLNMPGNDNVELVKHLQRQGRRRLGSSFLVDGVVGSQTNHFIVVTLGQQDSICGPAGWRRAVQ